MSNESKNNDPRFWKLWRESGAVGSMETAQSYNSSLGSREKGGLELHFDNKRGYTKKEQTYSPVPVIPRIMIVESLCTNEKEGTQNLRLCLLGREHTQEFYDTFSKVKHDKSPEDWTLIGEIQEYARTHEIGYVDPHHPNSSLTHRRVVTVNDVQYRLGDIVTEQEAFDFGYVEPYIDTVATKIVEASLLPGMTREKFTPFLREQGLIPGDQTAVYRGDTIDVVANERARDFECSTKPIEQNNRSHPINILVFRPGKDNVLPIGVAFLVPKENTIYEFMTSCMVE
jgi:hypothetical protein